MSNTQPGILHAPPGALLGGKYRVERELGKGGMGVVLLAHHEALDQHVAIKLLAPALADNAELVVRFQREARAAAKLQSDHVVRVSDVGAWEKIGPYMVMEYLEGSDLGQLLETRGPLPLAEAIDDLLEAIDAIAEAHALGIVHRDLKPTNLFLATRSDGRRMIKVLDFGVSKMEVVNQPTSKLTSTRALMGSPAYMSPEQLKSAKTVDGRADIWALGVVLFELLTGTLPFEGETVGALFANIIETPPRSLREKRPDVPELLEGVLQRCLRRNAADRYRNVGELAQALAPFGSGRATKEVERAVAFMTRTPAAVTPAQLRVPLPVQPGGPTPAPVPAASQPEAPARGALKGTQGSWGTSAAHAAPRSLAWVGLAVGAAVLLFAGLGLWLLFGRQSPPVEAVEPVSPTPVAAASTDVSPTASAAPTASASAPADSASAAVAPPPVAHPSSKSSAPKHEPGINLDSRH